MIVIIISRPIKFYGQNEIQLNCLFCGEIHFVVCPESHDYHHQSEKHGNLKNTLLVFSAENFWFSDCAKSTRVRSRVLDPL